MTTHADCIFCKIIHGEIPTAKVYENEDILAFLDISQVTEGHTLVIPKEHQKDIYELSPEVASKLFRHVPDIANAIKKQYNPEGMNLLNNNEEIAGQSVFHYHVHLIPRYGQDDGYGAVWRTHQDQYSNEDLKKIADGIRSHLE
ncbi:HIT family protein [Pseudalkalibacillus caeni]|uniref:HIT family protein n=1 Tax=Exobacillus caeni TaxID=2574798 RepID=A0A5R9F4V0_9BACL|nr:HIT family protein [Pseudalkalibacillus caeni]TLS38061.1 HIT family protein [Pseudalkalibacillus caeni]